MLRDIDVYGSAARGEIFAARGGGKTEIFARGGGKQDLLWRPY